jgi:hypothetical protein
VSPEDCLEGIGRSGEWEGLWGIAEAFGGDDDGVGCDNGPNIGMAVPIELVVGLG